MCVVHGVWCCGLVHGRVHHLSWGSGARFLLL